LYGYGGISHWKVLKLIKDIGGHRHLASAYSAEHALVFAEIFGFIALIIPCA